MLLGEEARALKTPAGAQVASAFRIMRLVARSQSGVEAGWVRPDRLNRNADANRKRPARPVSPSARGRASSRRIQPARFDRPPGPIGRDRSPACLHRRQTAPDPGAVGRPGQGAPAAAPAARSSDRTRMPMPLPPEGRVWPEEWEYKTGLHRPPKRPRHRPKRPRHRPKRPRHRPAPPVVVKGRGGIRTHE